MKLGLLIIDMQDIYLQDQMEKKKVDKACEYINYVADLLRSKGHVIIHIQDLEGLQEDNKELYHFIPEVHIESEDLIVSKENSNAFWNTELEQILVNQGVDLLIIAGFAAEHCVLFTYNGATERGFKPVILQNGILSTHNDLILSTYRDRNTISYPVIECLVQ